MAEEKSDALGTINKFLNRFSMSQKVFLGVVVLLSIVGIILIVNLATALNYGTLYTNLSAKDSAQIIEQLKTQKIPYRLEGGGSIIKVPDNKVAELRIQLASTGLPEGTGIGFEIFDKTSISTTDFVQNINYIRAVEGELARTLSQLREVNYAKVHITAPKRSVFMDEQEEAKASIVLSLQPGARVAGNLVPAILHLTAQSVEGLRAENIAIVDVSGNLLSKPSNGEEDIFTELTTNQLSYQKNMEQNLSKKIISLLEPYVGAGKVRADVKLKLNFDKVESTEETVDPESIAKVSEKSETSSSTGAGRAGGVPGVSSNVGQATGGETKQGIVATPSKSKKESSLVNYEISKKITHLTKPVGEVQQLSVAVVVDDAVDAQIQNGELIKQSRKRTAEELDAIKKIAQAAVGFNSQRGDVIEVANLAFDTSAETISQHYYDKQKKEKSNQFWFMTLPVVVIGSVILLFLIVTISKRVGTILKQAKLPKAEEVEIPRVDGEKLAALQEAKDEAEIERELMEKYKIPKSTKKMGIIREKVKKFANENIEEAASLVKSFIIE